MEFYEDPMNPKKPSPRHLVILQRVTSLLVSSSGLWLGVLFGIFFIEACSKVDQEPQFTSTLKQIPLAEYQDSTVLDMYEGSRLSWIMHTKHLVKWSGSDLVHAMPVDLKVYDSLGKILIKLTADSGEVDEGQSFLSAAGHVHGHSTKGVDLQTDSLRWNKSANQISTQARVRVVSEDGDVLTGRGFVSDAKLDNWQILADVKGIFQKVKARVQQQETAEPHVNAPVTAPAVISDSTKKNTP